MKIKHYITGIFLLLAFVVMAVAVPSYADENNDDEPSFRSHLPPQASERAHQVQACLQLGRVLGQGSSGNDVENLQRFLKEEGHFDFDQITGYFGPVTERAVQRFQEAQGIVSEGIPNETGYGQVGPRTAANIAKVTCLTGERPTDEPVTEPDDPEEVDEKVDIMETVNTLSEAVSDLLKEEDATEEKIDDIIEALKGIIEDLEEKLGLTEALNVAREWMEEESPTYTFDGDELEVVGWVRIEDGKYEFTFDFESSSAGYGDRTDEATAQVITPHTTVVVVDDGEVVSAITDEVYDEMADEMIDGE